MRRLPVEGLEAVDKDGGVARGVTLVRLACRSSGAMRRPVCVMRISVLTALPVFLPQAEVTGTTVLQQCWRTACSMWASVKEQSYLLTP